MPILRTCCCWKSLRHASIACGIYTGIYYTVNAIHSCYALRQDLYFFKNRSSNIPFLTDINGETTRIFSSLIFAFSSCGLISTVLLLYGIYRNIKYLLIPWIFNMVFFMILDIICVVQVLFIHVLQWSPSIGMILFVDFSLNVFNLYTVLCVTSQYQEYQAGSNLQNLRVANIQPVLRKPEINNSQTKAKKAVKFGQNIEFEQSNWQEEKNSPCKEMDIVLINHEIKFK